MVGMVGASMLLGTAALAQVRWTPFRNAQYGIEMLVPDATHCTVSEADRVGHMLCRYPGGMELEVYATPRAMTLPELRAAAAEEADDVPASAWQWRAVAVGSNGYRIAEAWSASGGGHHVLGLIGQSARRQMSHVVFISGPDAEWARNTAAINTFIDSVHAL